MLSLLALCLLSWTAVKADDPPPVPVFRMSFINMTSDGFYDDNDNVKFTKNGNGTLSQQTGTSGNYLEFNQYTYYTASSDSVPLSCVSDVDLCDDGFTLMAWVRPQRPWDPDFDSDKIQWFYSFGEGIGQFHGLQMGIRRKKFIVYHQATDAWKRVECKVTNATVPDEESWVHFSVKRRNSTGAPLFIHINGEQFRHDDEDAERKCTVNTYTPTKNQVTEKSREIVVGAAYDPKENDYVGEYIGDVADIRFYNDNLKISDIRDVWREGAPE